MRTAFPILAFIPVILLIAFGFMIFACPPCSGETPQTEGRESDTSLSQNSAEGFGSYDSAGLNPGLNENEQVNLNDVAVYNGMISGISVSPTVVSYDYNHDGVVDVKKTVLFFNIG
jgi:hypothetical protein